MIYFALIVAIALGVLSGRSNAQSTSTCQTVEAVLACASDNGLRLEMTRPRNAGLKTDIVIAETSATGALRGQTIRLEPNDATRTLPLKSDVTGTLVLAIAGVASKSQSDEAQCFKQKRIEIPHDFCAQQAAAREAAKPKPVSEDLDFSIELSLDPECAKTGDGHECGGFVELKNLRSENFKGRVDVTFSSATKGVITELTPPQVSPCYPWRNKSASCTLDPLPLGAGQTGKFAIEMRARHVTSETQLEVCAEIGASQSEEATNRTIQRALTEAGFDTGIDDGALGPTSLRALAAFKAERNLPAEPQITPELNAALGLSDFVDFVPENNRSCVTTNLEATALACGPATTIARNGACVCRYSNMVKRGATRCGCKAGFAFTRGKGCLAVKKAKDKVKKSTSKRKKSKCHLPSTREKGGKCVCRYKNMVRKDARTCLCRAGTVFDRKKGCVYRKKVCPEGSIRIGNSCIARKKK